MKSFNRSALYAGIGALSLAMAGTALAESNFQTNASGTITATARLDFQITIPRVLYLQVGTGGPFGTTNTSIDFITFAPSAANLGAGCGTPADCAGTGGNLTGGQVTASLISNVGTVKFSAATGGGSLNDGGTNTIPYVGQILVASTPTTGTLLTAPVFDAAAVFHHAGRRRRDQCQCDVEVHLREQHGLSRRCVRWPGDAGSGQERRPGDLHGNESVSGSATQSAQKRCRGHRMAGHLFACVQPAAPSCLGTGNNRVRPHSW